MSGKGLSQNAATSKVLSRSAAADLWPLIENRLDGMEAVIESQGSKIRELELTVESLEKRSMLFHDDLLKVAEHMSYLHLRVGTIDNDYAGHESIKNG